MYTCNICEDYDSNCCIGCTFDTVPETFDKSIMDVFCKNNDFKKPVWTIKQSHIKSYSHYKDECKCCHGSGLQENKDGLSIYCLCCNGIGFIEGCKVVDELV
jgi:hypothetical protein